MKTTIEMACEADCKYVDLTGDNAKSVERLERFEALVRADEREEGQRWFDAVTAQHKQEILAEREACAKACEARAEDEVGMAYEGIALDCAAVIRARGNT